jgi:respiratory burst oxidase
MNWLSVVQIIACGIAVGVFIHATCHLTCDIPKFVNAPHDKFEEYFGHDFDHQPSYAEVVRMPVGLTGIFMVAPRTGSGAAS